MLGGLATLHVRRRGSAIAERSEPFQQPMGFFPLLPNGASNLSFGRFAEREAHLFPVYRANQRLPDHDYSRTDRGGRERLAPFPVLCDTAEHLSKTVYLPVNELLQLRDCEF